MINPKTLHFGPAGIPPSSEKGVVSGISQLRKFDLTGMELEFVQQVYLTETLAKKLKSSAQDDILLTAHGSYYINLNAQEKEKIHMSKERILKAARMLYLAGGYSLTFHAAFYLQKEPKQVYEQVKKELKDIVETLKQEKNNIWIRPETTGKPTQFGTLYEILSLSQEIDNVMPCIDFSHLHARNNGGMNTEKEFRFILTEVEKALGKQGIHNMHIHLSGINYGPKGEKNHLNLKDSDMQYESLLKVLKEFNVKGALVCESPDIVGDAILLKKYYTSLK